MKESTRELPLNTGQLLALVDALQAGILNESQKKTVQELRTVILALVERGDEKTSASMLSIAWWPGTSVLIGRTTVVGQHRASNPKENRIKRFLKALLS